MRGKKLIILVITFIFGMSFFAGVMPVTKTAYAEGGLILNLKFDGDLRDSSGYSNDAVCSSGSITYDEGIFGKSAVFNGKSYLEIKNNESLNLNNFTISLWVYKTSSIITDDQVPYVCKEKSDPNGEVPYKLYEYRDNIPTIWLHEDYGNTEMNQFALDGNPIDIQKWVLLTATYNGSEVRMYENGVLTKKENISGMPEASSGNLVIGMDSGEYFYHGKMDDLRIYDYDLSAKEVVALYNEGLATNPKLLTQTNSLVAYYKFNGDYKDSSRFGNDSELAAGDVKFIDGVNGKAAKFSKGTYLEVTHSQSLNFDEGFSVTGWININEEDTIMTILNKTGVSTSANSNDYGFQIKLTDKLYDFNYIPFGWQPGAEYSRYSFDNSIKNKWVHFAVTYDAKDIRWYQNGKMVMKQEASAEYGTKLAHSVGKLTIGFDGEDFFKGAIDELKLYNYGLSAKEVETDAKQVDSLSITSSNVKAVKTMKVNDTIALTTSRNYIETGKSQKLSSGLTYKSSNSKVFTVDQKGKIKAIRKGSAKLIISHGGISSTYTVTVK